MFIFKRNRGDIEVNLEIAALVVNQVALKAKLEVGLVVVIAEVHLATVGIVEADLVVVGIAEADLVVNLVMVGIQVALGVILVVSLVKVRIQVALGVILVISSVTMDIRVA